MPERVVSTLLKIDGEQQYKAALTNVNREMSNLRSGVRLLDEQFKGQSNSMSALVAKQQALNALYETAKSKVALVKTANETAKSAVEKYSKEIDTLKTRIASEGDAEGKLAKQLITAQENLQKAQNATAKYSGDVTKAETEVAKLDNQLKDNAKYLEEAKKSATGTASSIDQYGKKVAQAGEETKQFGKTGKEAFDGLAQTLMSAGLYISVEKLVDLFKQAVDASIEWESAFTGVKKTVEGTPEQLAQINDEILKMSTEIPLTTTELAKIAETAGQLGIATENVTSFSEVMAALGVSTNLTAEQAATQLARFAKITGMTADEYDNLGSSIVELGNNSSALESEIVDMAMGIAAAGHLVGMSTSDIMAFAASLTSAGLESQAGGTAISRTLSEISVAANTNIKDLEKYAEVAGMTAEQFASMFKEDATGAFTAFVDGLAKSGDKAIAVLSDMGITEIRQRDALLRLSASQGDLASAIELSSTAFQENTALTEEASKRYDTTDSKIQLLKNSTNLLGITIGNQLNPFIRNSVSDLTDWVDAINAFLEENPAAIQGIVGFAAALATLAIALTGTSVALNIVIPAIVALHAALAASPIGIVIIALAALTAGIYAAASATDYGTEKYEDQIRANKELRSEMESTSKAFDDRISSIEAEGDAVDGLITQLEILTAAQGTNKNNSAEIKNVVDQLNTAVSDLNLTYDETTGTLNMTTEAIRDQTQAMFEQAYQAAMIDRQVESLIELQDAQNALKETTQDLADAQARYNANTRYVEDPNGNRFLLENAQAIALRKEIKRLEGEQKTQQEAVSDQKEKYDNLTESITGATDAIDGNTDATDDSSESVAQNAEEYQKLVENINAAADSVAGFGDKLDGASKKNIDYYIKGEKSQTNFWDSYSANLKKAQEMGLDEGLLSQFAKPTEENAQILNSIVKGTTDKIQELNDAYAANAQARKEFSEQSALAQSQAADIVIQSVDTSVIKDKVTDAIESVQAEVNSSAAGAGAQAGQKVVDEISTMDYSDASSALSTAFSQGFTEISNSFSTFLQRLHYDMGQAIGGVRKDIVYMAQEIARAISEIPTSITIGVNIVFSTGGFKNGISFSYGGFKNGNPISTGYILGHKGGLDYVPYDDYLFRAHEGEMVLTKSEATSYRAMRNMLKGTAPTASDFDVATNVDKKSGARSTGSSAGSASRTTNFTQNIITPKQPDEYELARLARKELRNIT